MADGGDLIGERYRLLERLGGGAMGVVWRARDTVLDRDVAVKELLINDTLVPGQAHQANERALREARIAARVHHPHAISIYDVVEHAGRPCLIMEFLPSRTLADLIAERGTLPVDQVSRIGAQIASGLAAAHAAGIVHRDVKPGNVLLSDDGVAKLTDFGISRASGDSSLTATGVVAGTPAYLAPEVAQGEPALQASDLFSLGATLHCAIEGTPPFGLDANPIALLYRIANTPAPPPRHAGPLTDILTRLLRTDPHQRPDAHETERALNSATVDLTPPPLDAQPSPTTARGPLGLTRRRAIVAGLVLAVLLTTGILVALATNSRPTTLAAAPPTAARTRPPSPTPHPTTTRDSTVELAPPPSGSPPTTTPASTASQLTDAIVGYYQLMPADLTTAWHRMTTDYQQNHAGGMSGYQQFWRPIAQVGASDITPSPPNSVTATITYHYRDGNVVVERTQFGLVWQDGTWKIASSTVLSHSGNP